MLFSKLYKIMVNKVTFVCFTGAIAPIAPPPGSAPGLNRRYSRLCCNDVFVSLLSCFWSPAVCAINKPYRAAHFMQFIKVQYMPSDAANSSIGMSCHELSPNYCVSLEYLVFLQEWWFLLCFLFVFLENPGFALNAKDFSLSAWTVFILVSVGCWKSRRFCFAHSAAAISLVNFACFAHRVASLQRVLFPVLHLQHCGPAQWDKLGICMRRKLLFRCRAQRVIGGTSDRVLLGKFTALSRCLSPADICAGQCWFSAPCIEWELSFRCIFATFPLG